jgi:hypothetical protein
VWPDGPKVWLVTLPVESYAIARYGLLVAAFSLGAVTSRRTWLLLPAVV